MSRTDSPPTTEPQPREEEQRSTVNKPVFVGSAVGTLVVTLWCVLAPKHAESTLATVVGYVSEWFGWYYVALATAILVFVLFLAFSRYGQVRLGPEHSRPAFSTLSWASMLFAAGIGTDLMFFAVNEPVVQYLTPPSGQGETVEAAREATAWTMFHYGISGWGMYALMGMALGYFAYRMNLPLAVRSALYPLIGKKVGEAVQKYGPIETRALAAGTHLQDMLLMSLYDPSAQLAMANTAEELARRYEISREEADALRRAVAAFHMEAIRFRGELHGTGRNRYLAVAHHPGDYPADLRYQKTAQYRVGPGWRGQRLQGRHEDRGRQEREKRDTAVGRTDDRRRSKEGNHQDVNR